MFGLSARQMEEEPLDKFFTNRYIYTQMEKRRKLEEKHSGQ